MKRLLETLGALLSALVLTASCIGDDDEATLPQYDDVAITSFVLGNLNCTTEAVTAAGKDTTIHITVTGSDYPMTIDHLGGRIYNLDSLPKGTDVAHVVASISTRHNGVLGLRELTDSTELYTFWTGTDSVDFTRQRQLRVYAINGTNTFRDYLVNINVAKTTGTAFAWQRTDSTELGQLSPMRLLSTAKGLIVVGRQDSQTLVYGQREGRWTRLNAAFDSQAWSQAVVKNGVAYLMSNGSLLSSEDGSEWQTVAQLPQVAQLIGADSQELFAYNAEHQLIHSADNGLSWTEEVLESAADADYLPLTPLASTVFAYAPSNQTDYTLLIGSDPRNGVFTSPIWRKICHHDGPQPQGQWTYMPYDLNNSHRLPALVMPSLAVYNNTIVAAGYGRTIWQSRDQGITWRKAEALELPSYVIGDAVAMTADSEGSLWVVTNRGEVVKGSLR